MAYAGGFANIYLEGIDSLPPHRQYQLLRDAPGGRFLAPEAKLRLFREGVPSSRALAGIRPEMKPLGVNTLPHHLWNQPCLIDLDHWAQVNEDVRSKGVILPCDFTEESLNPQTPHGAWMKEHSESGAGYSVGYSQSSRSSEGSGSTSSKTPTKTTQAGHVGFELETGKRRVMRRRGHSQVGERAEGGTLWAAEEMVSTTDVASSTAQWINDLGRTALQAVGDCFGIGI